MAGNTFGERFRIVDPGAPATFTDESPPWQSVQPRRTEVEACIVFGELEVRGAEVIGHEWLL